MMMATVSASEEIPVPSPQEILIEIRNFVRGTTFGSVKHSRELKLTRSALYLLRAIPSTREAILEYLRTIFDDALNVHSFDMELESASEPAGPINLQVGSSSETDDKVLQEVQDILSNFIVSNPEGWSSIISAWSLDLLGHLSSKYAERRGVPHTTNLNEVLQLWMSCKPTRILIELSTECISTLINSNPDSCIDALLETSVQQSPHFDWVVAHIGSCFPTTIINRVLACGLKDFCVHEELKDQNLALSDKKVPKIASVVGILGHLAGQHGQDIRQSLMELFESCFATNPSEQQLATVPFLLQLASMSPLLRKAITIDIIKALTPEVMNKLCVQIPKWHQKTNSQDPASDLMTLVVHLVLQSDEGGWDILEFLLNTATGVDERFLLPVSQTCGQVLDYLLLQIQKLVFTNSANFQVEIPILSTLDQHVPQLCQHLLADNVLKPYWLCKLLVFLANYRKQSITSDIIAYVLCEAKQPSQLQLLAHFMKLIEPTSTSELLETTISEILAKSIGKGNICSETFLSNLWLLIQWESKGFGGFDTTRLKFTSILNKFHVQLSKQLAHPSVSAASCVINTLAFLPFPEAVSVATLTSLSSATVNYFFFLFSELNLDEKMKKIPICSTFVSKLSHHACAQNLILRSLLEGVLLPSNSFYFGSTVAQPKYKTDDAKSQTSLLEENNKHSISIILPQSHSTVFHSGIIGEGRRPVVQRPKLAREEILVNVQLFLDVIKAACVPCVHSDEREIKNEPTPTLQGMKTVALLLVELISSDVMFNGLPWPEEEFIKVTIERDLHIKRMFDENPILWDLLLLLATYKPALCYCSVLLRALAAVNMTFWSATRGNSAGNCPKQLELAARLVNVMAIGQLIPPPISHVAEIFYKISPYEIYVLLQDLWKYMKANVPAPTVFTAIDSQGYPCREFLVPCPREFTSRLHRILQNNIENLGHLFIRFFSIEDVEETS